MSSITSRSVIFANQYIELIAKIAPGQGTEDPFYSLNLADYVAIVAMTTDEELLLVSQYRPAVECRTLELPAGCVDKDETPGACALRELTEETGYRATDLQLTGCLHPDTGRLGNKLWCYFTPVIKLDNPPPPPEADLQTLTCGTAEVFDLVRQGKMQNALHAAALYLAVGSGHLTIT